MTAIDVSGKCGWCGSRKANKYGLCDKCLRFPSQLDYERWDNTGKEESAE